MDKNASHEQLKEHLENEYLIWKGSCVFFTEYPNTYLRLKPLMGEGGGRGEKTYLKNLK